MIYSTRSWAISFNPNTEAKLHNDGDVVAVKGTDSSREKRERSERLQRGSLCVDTQYAGGVYLQPVLGGQVHRQSSLPSSLLPPVMDKTGGMYMCVCVSVYVYRCRSNPHVSLYCSNFHYSSCMSQRYSLHFLYATLYQYFTFGSQIERFDERVDGITSYASVCRTVFPL